MKVPRGFEQHRRERRLREIENAIRAEKAMAEQAAIRARLCERSSRAGGKHDEPGATS